MRAATILLTARIEHTQRILACPNYFFENTLESVLFYSGNIILGHKTAGLSLKTDVHSGCDHLSCPHLNK